MAQSATVQRITQGLAWLTGNLPGPRYCLAKAISRAVQPIRPLNKANQHVNFLAHAASPNRYPHLRHGSVWRIANHCRTSTLVTIQKAQEHREHYKNKGPANQIITSKSAYNNNND